MDEQSTPIVMVLGKSGVGKSTLGNYFLYDSPEHDGGFKAEKGGVPVTFKCEGKTVESTPAPVSTGKPGGSLTVIDTPGIPDPPRPDIHGTQPPPIRTLEFYNDIVLTMRRIGGLNALVFLMKYSDDRAQVRQDFRAHRILLEQFGGLLCPKVVQCRYSVNPDLPEEKQEAEVKVVHAWVKDLMAEVKMETSFVILVNECQPQRERLFAARQILVDLPFTPITAMNIRTTDEMQESARRLVDDDTRREELEKKRRVLMREKEQGVLYFQNLERMLKDAPENDPEDVPGHGRLWGGVIAVGSFIVNVLDPLGGLTVEIWRKLIEYWLAREADIDSEVQIILKELDGDYTTKVEALERDAKVLLQLEELDQMCVVPNPNLDEVLVDATHPKSSTDSICPPSSPHLKPSRAAKEAEKTAEEDAEIESGLEPEESIAAFAVTILEDLEIKDAPRVSEGGGVRLSIPSQSRGGRIGPITVEEAIEVMDGNDGTVLVLTQVVHCLPDLRRFEEPLTLDFAVRDGSVWWWGRAAIRQQVLREYQILSKQSEDDPWEEMRPEDVSVVWDDQGSTCLRARVKHFTWFSSAKRIAKASANSVSLFWNTSVLVANATDCVAHVTSMPTSFKTGDEGTKVCSLTFWEIGISFEAGEKVERIMLPAGTSSEIIPAGGMTELFLSGGAKEMRIIVCFLPGRGDVAAPVRSSQAASPLPGASSAPRATSPSPVKALSTATSTRQATTTGPQACRTAAPSPGGSPPLGGGALTRAPSPVSGTASPQSAAGEKSSAECEDMVYSMAKVMPRRRRLTLLRASVNRKIKIKKNARALETYAMMLADFGKPPP